LADSNLEEMLRRLPALSLLLAWLCASGAMLDIAQVFAWTRMFAGYTTTKSVVAAAKETFDPDKPCAICRALSKAREASDQHGPAVPTGASEKIILILDGSTCFVPLSARQNWPEPIQGPAVARIGDVPVPPPKSFGA
jgi:hypothetical protein